MFDEQLAEAQRRYRTEPTEENELRLEEVRRRSGFYWFRAAGFVGMKLMAVAIYCYGRPLTRREILLEILAVKGYDPDTYDDDYPVKWVVVEGQWRVVKTRRVWVWGSYESRMFCRINNGETKKSICFVRVGLPGSKRRSYALTKEGRRWARQLIKEKFPEEESWTPLELDCSQRRNHGRP